MTPLRTCAGCRAKRPKGELVRITSTPEGPRVDLRQRMPGRGAYLCRDEGCLAAGVARGGLSRTLRINVPPAARQDLLRAFRMGVE